MFALFGNGKVNLSVIEDSYLKFDLVTILKLVIGYDA